MQSMIRRMESVKSFFSCFDNSVSIDEFNEAIKEFDFIKPIALIAYKLYLKDTVFINGNEFSLIQKKILLVFLMALIEKLSEGNVCILLTKDKLTSLFCDEITQLNLFTSRLDEDDLAVFNNDIDSYKESVCAFIEQKIIPNYIQMLSAESRLISPDLNAVSPLCVYTEDKVNYRLYLRSYFHYENTVCDYIKTQNNRMNSLDDTELEFYKKALNVLFDSEDEIEYQKIAAAQSAINQFSVICGGPGTGKTTTVIKLLLLLLAANKRAPLKITLCAPTGKASSRMVESISSGLLTPNIGDAIRRLCELNKDLSEEELKKSIPTSATTIHRVLGIYPHKEIPKYNESNKLDCDIIVIDEVSMISLSLFSKIIKALPEKTKVIMLGDKDQLNSVQPGSVLADICSQLYKDKTISEQKLSVISKITSYSHEDLCRKYNNQSAISDNVSLLLKSRRFDSNSVLGIVANNINASNKIGDEYCKKTDENIAKATSIEDLFRSDKEVSFCNIADKSRKYQLKFATSIAREIVDKYSKDGAYINLLEQCNYIVDKNNPELSKKIFNALDKYRVLCALNEGCLGTKVINSEIAKLLHKRIQSKKTKFRAEIPLKNQEGEFAVGSVILITENDKLLGVDNGEVGFVAYDSKESMQKGSVKVFFPAIDKNEPRVISPERLKKYDAGFAMTIHKSQGCEYQHVCMVLPPIDNPIMTKELIYTGITRAKASLGADPRVYIIGDEKLFLSSIVKRVKRESGLSLMI